MTRRTVSWWSVVGVVALSACGPSSEQRAALRAWYACIECDAGELDSLVARADFRLLPELGRGLQGPSQDEIAQTTVRLRAEHALIGAGATPEDALVASLLSNFIAQRQRRAAEALGGFRGWRPTAWLARRALSNALDRETAYRDDVREATRSALVDTIVKVAGDGQSDSAWRPVPVPPRVQLRAGTDTMAGVDVRFRATFGGGRVEGYRQQSDSLGEAEVSAWIIGVGPNELVARAGDDSAVFRATGLPATRMIVDSGFPTAVPFDSWVMPVVRLFSSGGPPVAGQLVRFVVVQGGPILRGSILTDSEGRARPGAWRVDSGPNVLAVFAAGFPGLDVRVWGLPRRSP